MARDTHRLPGNGGTLFIVLIFAMITQAATSCSHPLGRAGQPCEKMSGDPANLAFRHRVARDLKSGSDWLNEDSSVSGRIRTFLSPPGVDPHVDEAPGIWVEIEQDGALSWSWLDDGTFRVTTAIPTSRVEHATGGSYHVRGRVITVAYHLPDDDRKKKSVSHDIMAWDITGLEKRSYEVFVRSCGPRAR